MSTDAQLVNALESTRPTTIIIQDGIYSKPPPKTVGPNFPKTPSVGYVRVGAGHQVFAARSGHARLTYGLSVNAAASGLRIRGVVFDIDDPLDGFYTTPKQHPSRWLSAAVAIWGGAQNVVLEDFKIFGNQALHAGVWATSPDGLRISRALVKDVRRFGLLVGDHTASAPIPVTRPLIEDIEIDGVFDSEYEDYVAADPDETFGTQLHGIFLRTPGYITRARIRRIAHSGIGLGNVNQPMIATTLSDIDVDAANMSNHTIGTGIYLERQLIYAELNNFCVGANVDRGVNVEWGHAPNVETFIGHCPSDDDNDPPPPAPIPSRHIYIRNGLVRASQVGVYVGLWTRDTNLRNLHFENASWAAVGAHDNQGNGTNTEEQGLSFGVLGPGACPRTLDHPSQTMPSCVASLPAPSNIAIPPAVPPCAP